MGDIYLRVKGIIKKDGKYLLIKRWVDDRIPDPIGIAYICSIEDEGNIVLGEEYDGWEWVEKERFPDYIDNRYVLKDLEGAGL